MKGPRFVEKKVGEIPLDVKVKKNKKDWKNKCEVCNGTPVLPETGLCGPCTFGEADTANGNW